MRSASFCAVLFVSALIAALANADVCAQSRVNASGTGGIHEIRGRIHLPSGRGFDSMIKVELQSISNFTALELMTDREGSYSFKNLAPGNYTVVVKGDGYFEDARESVTIDTEAQGNIRMRPIPKVVTVPIYLQMKRGVVLRNEVINAKWSTIPRATLSHFKRGVELAQENKNAEAEIELRKAIELSPQFAPAHTALAGVALATGNLEKSVESCKNAIKYDQSDFDAHLTLGIAYMNMRKFDLAEPELVTAAYLNRYEVRPHYYLGMMYVVKNDLEVAQKAFETARELNGGRSIPNIHKMLGRIYMKKEMEKEAIQELETYLKLAPKASDADKVKKDISDIKAKPPKHAFV